MSILPTSKHDALQSWGRSKLLCRGFVAHFFQCSDCANHFGEMAAEQAAKDVKSRKDGVMWMWSAHNEVLHNQAYLVLCRNASLSRAY